MVRLWALMARLEGYWTTKNITRSCNCWARVLFVNFWIYFMSKSSKIFKYVGKRLLQGVPIIIAIVVINFFLLNLAEGDAVDVLAGEAGSATPSIWSNCAKDLDSISLYQFN